MSKNVRTLKWHLVFPKKIRLPFITYHGVKKSKPIMHRFKKSDLSPKKSEITFENSYTSERNGRKRETALADLQGIASAEYFQSECVFCRWRSEERKKFTGQFTLPCHLFLSKRSEDLLVDFFNFALSENTFYP